MQTVNCKKESVADFVMEKPFPKIDRETTTALIFATNFMTVSCLQIRVCKVYHEKEGQETKQSQRPEKSQLLRSCFGFLVSESALLVTLGLHRREDCEETTQELSHKRKTENCQMTKHNLQYL